MGRQAVLERPVTDGSALTRRYRGLGRAGTALLVVGAFCTLMASVSLWSWRTFANSEGFADAATDMLKEPAVAEAVADQIVGLLQEQAATAQAAVAVRPLLRQIVAEVVTTEAFRGLFHAGVREMHAAVVNGHRTRLLVRVDDAAHLVKDALQLVNPSLAEAIPDRALAVAVGVSQSRWADLFMRAADIAGWLILPFAAAAAGCFIAAVRKADDRRRALEAVGLCLLAVGALIFAVLAALLNVTADVGEDPRQRTALRAVFWSAMHVLNVTGKVLIVIGIVVAFAAALAGRGPVRARLTELASAGRDALARPGFKALAAATAFVLGVVGLVWPIATAELLVRMGAVALVVLGAVWVFDLVGASNWVSASPSRSRVTPRHVALGGTTGLAMFSLVLLLGGMSFVRAVRAPALDRLGIDDAGCNGHLTLCDRQVDEVAFAGSHNAMAASADDGWFVPRQTGGLGAQLARGVRAFLLDLYYGAPLKSVVRTDFLSASDRESSRAQLSSEEEAALGRTLALFGADLPDESRQVYLCHLFCELGSTPAREAFRLFHDFLRVNPNEVVLLVLEDHVTPEDAARVMEQSGLADRAYTWPQGADAPTLRQLIEAKRNVVVLAENGGGAARTWYHSAYAPGAGKLEDTPHHFQSLAELKASDSCAVLRGTAAAPLLLLNHWIDDGLPSPNLAAEANSADILQARAQRCRKERHQIPNIVAVDFYSRGDVFRVVDRLNGIDLPDAVIATVGR